MDNYQEAIERISNAVRDQEAWPDDSSKLQEQLNLLFVATLAVGSEIPLDRLSLSMSNDLSMTELTGATKKYDLPTDLFTLRGDKGIHHFDLDGEIVFPFQQINLDSLLQAGKNKFHRGKKLFALDLNGKSIYANYSEPVKVNYVPKFTKPTTGDYSTSGNFPLNEKDGQRAVHLVAYHVSGVTIRDSAAAQFHALLSNEYNNESQQSS